MQVKKKEILTYHKAFLLGYIKRHLSLQSVLIIHSYYCFATKLEHDRCGGVILGCYRFVCQCEGNSIILCTLTTNFLIIIIIIIINYYTTNNTPRRRFTGSLKSYSFVQRIPLNGIYKANSSIAGVMHLMGVRSPRGSSEN